MDKDINRIKAVLAEKGGAARLLSQSRQDLRDFISDLGHNPMMSEQKSEIIE